MDVRLCLDLLKRLEIDLLPRASYECLDQSCQACEAGDWQQMLTLAQFCCRIALECKDQISQAAALVHRSIAHAQQDQFDKAIQACEEAKRIYHRNPDQRHNEGTVAYGLGLIYQQKRTPSKAIGYYEEAHSVYEEVRNGYAASGNTEQFEVIQTMCDDISERIDALMPESV